MEPYAANVWRNRCGQLRTVQWSLTLDARRTLATAFTESRLDYCNAVLHGASPRRKSCDDSRWWWTPLLVWWLTLASTSTSHQCYEMSYTGCQRLSEHSFKLHSLHLILFLYWHLSSKFPVKQYLISHHTSNGLLHYLVKCLCLKIAMQQSWVKRNDTQDSAIRNHFYCWKIFIPWRIASFVHWWKDIYSGHTEKPTEWPTAYGPTRSNHGRKSRQNACAIDWHSVTDGISQRVTSGWQCTSFIHLYHEVEINEAYYRIIVT